MTTLNKAKASTTKRPQADSPSPGGASVSRLKGKSWLVALAAILVLAAALRIAWIVYADARPGEPILDDVAFYDFVAQSVANGTGYVHFYLQGEDPPATAQWPPGYPLVLAGIYKAFGHDIHLAKALNVIAGMATCLLIYAIGSRLFDRRTALLGALIFALFPSAIHYSTLLSTESTFPVLLYAMVFLLFLWGARDAPFSPLKLLALGVLFGAAALYRSEAGLLFIAVVLAWLLTQSNWRPVLARASLMGVGAIVVILPWTVRNYVQMDAFIPIASGVGHTFLTGHREEPYDPLDVFPEAEIQTKYRYLPREEREVRVEQEALREGLEYMWGHPAEELDHLWEKFQRLYEDDSDALRWVSRPLTQSPEIERTPLIPEDEWDTWSSIADKYYFVVMGLFLLSLPFWLSLRDYPRLLLALVIVLWNVAHLVFFPLPRYHAPLVPLFSLFAAYTLVLAWQRLSVFLRHSTENVKAKTRRASRR